LIKGFRRPFCVLQEFDHDLHRLAGPQAFAGAAVAVAIHAAGTRFH
jgi:hypothetical protein